MSTGTHKNKIGLRDSTGLDINPATEDTIIDIIGNRAVKLVEDGDVIYLGEAAIGSSAGSAVWRIQKIDTSSGVTITWADGNDNFDNVFNNYSSISYS